MSLIVPKTGEKTNARNGDKLHTNVMCCPHTEKQYSKCNCVFCVDYESKNSVCTLCSIPISKSVGAVNAVSAA